MLITFIIFVFLTITSCAKKTIRTKISKSRLEVFELVIQPIDNKVK